MEKTTKKPTTRRATTPKPVETPVKVLGVVANCSRVNVRKIAKPNGDILCVLDSGMSVQIDKKASRNGFYKVTTDTGIDGFVMENFIEVK